MNPVANDAETLVQTVGAVAAQLGARVHNVHAHDVRGRRCVSLHLEVDDSLTLGAARVLADRFEAIETFSIETSEQVIRDMAEEYEIKAGILINGIRLAVTGQAVGPGLFDVLMAVGRDRVVARLRKAVKFFEQATQYSL